MTRYEALLHVSTHTARSGRERFLSLVAPSALSQLNPCVRILGRQHGLRRFFRNGLRPHLRAERRRYTTEVVIGAMIPVSCA